LFFSLNSVALGVILFGIILGAAAVGVFVGRRHRHRREELREPFGALQAALLGVVGLVLAFGLALAVGRYEARRTVVVDDANAIGTTWLRAQTLDEPTRSRSLVLIRAYVDTALRLSNSVPGSSESASAAADGDADLQSLWALAGPALDRNPTASAPRLYVESLNEMIDMQTVRVSALNNRVPGAILTLEVLGAAFAVGLLAAYLSILGRGILTIMMGAILVSLLLLVTFDLDRPTRGFIKIPATPLTDLRTSMDQPPAAGGAIVTGQA